ncbi:MAG: VOC family protein [Patescibacteria group bacterium]|jgi:hypothetical protein
MSNRVIHFEIQADDPDRASNFYQKALGWKIEKYPAAEGSGMDYWMLFTGEKGEPGIGGGMYKRPADNKLHTYDCTIDVDDIDKVTEAIKKNGGKILKEKEKMEGIGWIARAEDTEGNIFAIMQAVEPKP